MIKFILFPFSLIYHSITNLRNCFYDWGLFKTTKTIPFSINVGNLTVGGTGKTPQIEYLIRLLSNTYILSTLSRGYGRKTKGFLLADQNCTAETLGDEPFQYFKKFGKKIQIAVCENRVLGIKKLLDLNNHLEIVLLDDAYQHRAIKPNINILLTDFKRLFYEDFLLPAGRLRESRLGAKRADLVIISKCPENMDVPLKQIIIENIKKYTQENVPIFFSKIKYCQPKCYDNSENEFNEKSILLVSAIAQPSHFEAYLKQNYEIKRHFIFPDHHAFTRKELDKIIQNNINSIILSTEKDMVKIVPFLKNDEMKYFYYLPIEVQFLADDGKTFADLILGKIEENKN